MNSFWFWILVAVYFIIGRINLSIDCTVCSNVRILKRGGFFGGDIITCDTHKRKPTRRDIVKSLFWLPWAGYWFTLATLWILCNILYLSDTKFAKWLYDKI